MSGYPDSSPDNETPTCLGIRTFLSGYPDTYVLHYPDFFESGYPGRPGYPESGYRDPSVVVNERRLTLGGNRNIGLISKTTDNGEFSSRELHS